MTNGVRVVLAVFGLLAGVGALGLAVWAMALANQALRELKKLEKP